MKFPRGLVWKIPLLCLCGGILLLYVAFDLSCPLRRLTGIPCPGCGMARAWLHALRLDLLQAFRFHPLFWCVPVLGLFLLYDCRPFEDNRINNAILIGMLAAVLVCYAIRLILYFQGILII